MSPHCVCLCVWPGLACPGGMWRHTCTHAHPCAHAHTGARAPTTHLDEQVLLHHLLGLADEPLLQRLDLLDHLVRRRVAALQLAPPACRVWACAWVRVATHARRPWQCMCGEAAPADVPSSTRGRARAASTHTSAAQHLCTLSGLSSSSLSALTLVRSCSSCRPRLATCTMNGAHGHAHIRTCVHARGEGGAVSPAPQQARHASVCRARMPQALAVPAARVTVEPSQAPHHTTPHHTTPPRPRVRAPRA
jgi:hypothetical protein